MNPALPPATPRVALVLGAVKGIGMGIGLDLARRGYRVALTYYDWEDELPGMQADFAVFGTNADIFQVDLRDCDSVLRLIPAVMARIAFGEMADDIQSYLSGSAISARPLGAAEKLLRARAAPPPAAVAVPA